MHGRVTRVGLAGCLVLALFTNVQSKSIDIVLEHDLQGSFQKGGRIRGTLAPQGVSSLALQREPWGDADKAAFAELVKGNGYYRLRVPQSGDTVAQPLLFSVPARCLASSGQREVLKVHATPEGSIVGLEYDSKAVRCRALKEHAVTWAPPAESPVYVDVPGKGPGVSMDPGRQFPGAEQPVGTGSRGGGAGLGALLQQEEVPQGGAEGEKAGGEDPPLPDKRTWLQKNWIFVLPAVMLAMNVFGTVMNPPGGDAGAAAQNARPAQPRVRPR